MSMSRAAAVIPYRLFFVHRVRRRIARPVSRVRPRVLVRVYLESVRERPPKRLYLRQENRTNPLSILRGICPYTGI